MRKLSTVTSLRRLPALLAVAALPFLAHCTHSDAAAPEAAQVRLRPVHGHPAAPPEKERDRIKLRYFGGPKYPMWVEPQPPPDR